MTRLLQWAWEGCLVWVLYKIALRLSDYRWAQLKELGLFCAFLAIIMIVYKKWHGQPVVW